MDSTDGSWVQFQKHWTCRVHTVELSTCTQALQLTWWLLVHRAAVQGAQGAQPRATDRCCVSLPGRRRAAHVRHRAAQGPGVLQAAWSRLTHTRKKPLSVHVLFLLKPVAQASYWKGCLN